MSPHPNHPVLYTCHELRDVTIKKFGLTFAFGTYINFDSDVIFPDLSLTVNHWGRENMALLELLRRHTELTDKMKKLALVDVGDLHRLYHGMANPRGIILEKFRALEELFVGLRDDRISDGCLTPRAVTFMACEEYLPSATLQERYWEKTEQVWVREARVAIKSAGF